MFISRTLKHEMKKKTDRKNDGRLDSTYDKARSLPEYNVHACPRGVGQQSRLPRMQVTAGCPRTDAHLRMGGARKNL